MAYLDLVNQLAGEIPGLSPLLARLHINAAWNDIRDERNWSWLVTDAVVVCPAVETDGAVAFTQYTDTVVLDATASAAMLAQCQVGAVPGILQLQIRFGSSPTVGQIYSILAADITNPAAIQLTLSRVIVEATNATSAYMIYRAYVVPPISDFKSWQSLVDMANAYTIIGKRSTITSAQLDARDPQRQAMGLAFYIASWGSNRITSAVTGAMNPNSTVNAGIPIYELWPHPTNGQTFYCRIKRTGEAFIQQTDAQPDIIPNSMILQRAKGWYSYPFAKANTGNFPTFKGVDWSYLIANEKASYKETLLEVKRNDNEQELQDVWNTGHGLRTAPAFGRFGPTPLVVDSNWLQSHLVNY
jgi:hypothetical protein